MPLVDCSLLVRKVSMAGDPAGAAVAPPPTPPSHHPDPVAVPPRPGGTGP